VRVQAAATDVAEQTSITRNDIGKAVTLEEYAVWNGMARSCPIERAYVVSKDNITVRTHNLTANVLRILLAAISHLLLLTA
jgi:hypothetical protein